MPVDKPVNLTNQKNFRQYGIVQLIKCCIYIFSPSNLKQEAHEAKIALRPLCHFHQISPVSMLGCQRRGQEAGPAGVAWLWQEADCLDRLCWSSPDSQLITRKQETDGPHWSALVAEFNVFTGEKEKKQQWPNS